MPFFPSPRLLACVVLCCLLAPAGSGSREALAGPCTSTGCHADIIDLPKLHSPVESGECTSCHLAQEEEASQHQKKPASFKAFRLPETTGPFCYECHDTMTKESVVHPPAKDGECLACHSPHGGTTQALLKGKEEAELCFECHENTDMVKATQHSPVAEGTCTACHDPHASKEKSLLKRAANAICYECHDDKQELLRKKSVHSPFKEDGCLACHLPHSSTVKSLVKSETLVELCFECHQEINPELEKKYKGAKHPHAPVQAGNCTACHDPHASDFDELLLASPQTICFRCHAQIKSDLAKAVSRHAPLTTKGCAACHDAHGSASPKLLVKNYSAKSSGKQGPDPYQLCFGCHDKAMLDNPKTNDTTDFRDGGTNLHYTHVVKPTNGRSCKSCHDPHGSLQKKLISPSVPFGKGAMRIKIKYARTVDGGTCVVGCHKPKTYDRKSPRNP